MTEETKQEERRVVKYAIDFDGTIVRNKFPDIGENIPEVVEFIKKVQARGDKWVLWTCRDGENLRKAVDHCHKNGLIPDAINDNLPETIERVGRNTRKIMADVYIDDHNARGLQIPTGD